MEIGSKGNEQKLYRSKMKHNICYRETQNNSKLYKQLRREDNKTFKCYAEKKYDYETVGKYK